jgi:hypothetical protein
MLPAWFTKAGDYCAAPRSAEWTPPEGMKVRKSGQGRGKPASPVCHHQSLAPRVELPCLSERPEPVRPDDIVDAVSPTKKNKARLSAGFKAAADKNVYRIHHRVDALNLPNTIAEAFEALSNHKPSELGNATSWNGWGAFGPGAMAHGVGAVKDSDGVWRCANYEPADSDAPTTSHRDSRRAVRPVWNKDELRRLRAEQRVIAKTDPHCFLKKQNSKPIGLKEMAKLLFIPDDVEMAHRLLDLVCDNRTPEPLRLATTAAIKAGEQLPQELVTALYSRLNLPAPRIRSNLPGVDVKVDGDKVEVSIRAKELSRPYAVKVKLHDEDGNTYDVKVNLPAAKKKPTKPKLKGIRMTILEALALDAVRWTEPSWLEPESDCEVFDLVDLLDADESLAIAA